MRVTSHTFLVDSFGTDLEKIKKYLYDENILEVQVNFHTRVNISNYLANFSTYNIISHNLIIEEKGELGYKK